MMEWWSAAGWLTTGVAALAAVFLYYEYKFSYWRRRGVPHPRPVPVLGNFEPLQLGRKNFAQGLVDQALPFRERGFCGLYQFGQPMLLVWDPEMAKQVLCKDFAAFHDRGVPVDERDPLTQHLFNLSGHKWRNLRNRLSPTFTSGKLKLMLPLMRDVGQELSAAVVAASSAADAEEVEIDTLLFRYATDVIGTVAFGIQCNSLRDQGDQFLAMSRQVLNQSPAQLARLVLEAIHPRLGRLLPYKWIVSNVHDFFLGLVRDTVKHREENKVVRNDFVQLLMQLRDQELAQADPDKHIALTPGVMAAQSFIFFVAGLDNISNTVSFCLSRLAADTGLQDRVAAEVRDVLHQHGGELSYEALKKMDLLNRTVLEGLRLWSPIGLIIRQCNAPTQVGGVLVDKGVPVVILADVMHSDENLFPEPKRFDPDRHTAEARAQRHPYAFLPFGEGPRVCIAERLALLEMRLALATLLRDFAFAVGPGYEDEVQLDPKAFFPRPKNGFKLRVLVRCAPSGSPD